MSTAVLYEARDNIALLTLSNPPVNGLGLAVRQSLQTSLHKALLDDAIEAIVITGRGKLFCGGADISEFASGKAFDEPGLPGVLDEIDASSKLVVAAVNGAALGGGLELALSCDYRFVHPSASLGLPEVHLGILPGAGGTQRLPRHTGVQTALEMIVSGSPVRADKGLDAGIADRIAHGDDFLEEALQYARDLVEDGTPARNTADMNVDIEDVDDQFFEQFRHSIARKTRGLFAPERCIQAVQAACSLPLKEGLMKEAELVMECMNSYQARAQQHLFFAERAAKKVPGVDPKTPTRPVEKVAVIGAGTMGGGIAMNFLNAGIPVTILEVQQDYLDRGLSVIRKNYEISAKRGRLRPEEVEQRMTLLTDTLDYEDLADADLVIEAVFESMEIKHKVFTQLDKICKPGAILATNTSTLDVNEIAAVTRRPQDVIGLHFFSPANVMRLLEIVRADQTADDVIVTTLKIAGAIKKVPVVVGVCYGFVGNRMLEPYTRETGRLLLEGATPEQIDKAACEFGMAMGPASMSDLAGIDVGFKARSGRPAEFDIGAGSKRVADRLYELGRYGQKTQRGYYLYEGRDQKPDPEVIAICVEFAQELGITRREIADQEIIERLFFTMIDEGARILEEGIASRASDIDIIYCNGYGFPIGRGGPMQYANEVGLDRVLAGLEKYREQLGEYGRECFQPSGLLKKLAAEGRTFNHL